MPVLVVLLAVLIAITVSVLILPWSVLQRYRAGTSRRMARAWLALINSLGIGFSAAIFLVSAAVISVWVSQAFTYSVGGLATGCMLGLIGLWLTSWERNSSIIHYTPNRWLVLAITVTVAGRLCYGFWRSWHVWQDDSSTDSWITASGFNGSLAAGALVLGYYMVFWTGVWIFARRHRTLQR